MFEVGQVYRNNINNYYILIVNMWEQWSDDEFVYKETADGWIHTRYSVDDKKWQPDFLPIEVNDLKISIGCFCIMNYRYINSTNEILDFNKHYSVGDNGDFTLIGKVSDDIVKEFIEKENRLRQESSDTFIDSLLYDKIDKED